MQNLYLQQYSQANNSPAGKYSPLSHGPPSHLQVHDARNLSQLQSNGMTLTPVMKQLAAINQNKQKLAYQQRYGHLPPNEQPKLMQTVDPTAENSASQQPDQAWLGDHQELEEWDDSGLYDEIIKKRNLKGARGKNQLIMKIPPAHGY